MEFSLSKVIAVLIAVALLFGYPLYQQAQRHDELTELVVHGAVTEFVDAVRTKGYITAQMYNDFNRKLGATGNQYDVQMEHMHKKYNPIYTDPSDLSSFKNTFEIYFNGHYTDEIMESLFPSNTSAIGRYPVQSTGVSTIKSDPMSVGDFFTVKVKNINRTMATILRDFFTGGNTGSNTTLYIPYGGMIINEDD